MVTSRRSRHAVICAFLLCVTALGAGVWRYSYGQALDQLAQRGASDLALASDRVTGQLQRYRELAVLMADHPDVAALTQGTGPQVANALFEEVADKTAALEIFFVDVTGRIIAAARGETGETVAKGPLLRRALNGALGADHAVAGLVPQRAYYFAAPHFGPDRAVHGAVVVAVDISEIEWDWNGSNPAVFFTDVDGEVFISNRSELTYWVRPVGQPGLSPPIGPQPSFAAYFVGSHEIWRMGWGPYLPERALHIIRQLPVIGLRAETLIDIRPALRLAGLQAGTLVALCMAFGAMLFLVTERRRSLAELNVVLEARVAARTEDLSATNARLRREISEREETEKRLKKAQQELVQAAKLSALGHMSAGISHELNQPLMAIQSFAENGTAFLERDAPDKAGENLSRISDLAHRMGRIIRNFRAFARQESLPVGRVELGQILGSAVELTADRLRTDGITLKYAPPDNAIWVRGGDVRLGQVFVNLITNAADAMINSVEKQITIQIAATDRLIVEIRDSGPGIDVPDKVFEPFYSTKQVETGQDGMGLGLSISYGIVQSFGGQISGRNSTLGGAVFSVALDRWQDAEAAE
ncbi:MAG: ATP-binding protein [Aliishimia sp.]